MVGVVGGGGRGVGVDLTSLCRTYDSGWGAIRIGGAIR